MAGSGGSAVRAGGRGSGYPLYYGSWTGSGGNDPAGIDIPLHWRDTVPVRNESE